MEAIIEEKMSDTNYPERRNTDQIEKQINTVLVKMDDILKKHHENNVDHTKIVSQLDFYIPQIQQVNATMYGNGKEGLVTSMAKIFDKVERIDKWLYGIGSGIFIAIALAILNLVIK